MVLLHFIKGRTFEPRAKLAISIKDRIDDNDMAIVRFTVVNIGKVKLSSLTGVAKYFMGKTDTNGIVYAPYYIEKDILRNYREPNEDLILEPGDELNVDIPLLIKGVDNSLLMIKSAFKVAESRAYRENAVFYIKRGGLVK